jgi:hypothetical protein
MGARMDAGNAGRSRTEVDAGRRAHVRTPLLDRLIARTVYAEAILPAGGATSQVGIPAAPSPYPAKLNNES